MTDNGGVFIAIEEPFSQEGLDYFDEIVSKLKSEGYTILALSWPEICASYNNPLGLDKNTSQTKPGQLAAYRNGLFQSLDKLEIVENINSALENKQIVLMKNWSVANLLSNSKSLTQPEDRRGFFVWQDHLDNEMLDIPRPTKSYVIKQQNENQSTEIPDRLALIDELCRLFPRDYVCIDTTRSGSTINRDRIADMILKSLEPLLPKKSEQKEISSTHIKNTPNSQENQKLEITKKGSKLLKKYFSEKINNIYTLRKDSDNTEISSILSNFVQGTDSIKIAALKTIDKIQGLESEENINIDDIKIHKTHSHYFVFENISGIVSSIILSQGLETYTKKASSRLETPHKLGHHEKPYYIPKNLDRVAEAKYRAAMDAIYSIRNDLAAKFSKAKLSKEETHNTQEALELLLPQAHKQTIVAKMNGGELQKLIIELAVSRQKEAIETAKSLAKYIYKYHPLVFHDLIDTPEVLSGIKYSKKYNDDLSKLETGNDGHRSQSTEPIINQVSYYPRNELNILPSLVYEYSSLAFEELETNISQWPIGKKLETLSEAYGLILKKAHPSSTAIGEISYRFEITCSNYAFERLQKIISSLPWTTKKQINKLGFFIPTVIEGNDMTDQYNRCFKLYENIHSVLLNEGYKKETAYLTLNGHRTRNVIEIKALELARLHSSRRAIEYPETKQIIFDIIDQSTEVHPLLSEALDVDSTD